MASGYDIRLPVSTDPEDGVTMIKKVKELVQQYMKMLMLTSPGERIKYPNYGAGLRKFLFEPNVNKTRGDIEGRIVTQVGTYLPYVDINDVTFFDSKNSDISDNTLLIRIDYTISSFGVSDVIVFSSDDFR